MHNRKATDGYSLYELIMTTVLVSAVVTLGVPSFNGMLADNRLRTDVDALFHAVHLARQESILRRRAVTLCPSHDGSDCIRSTDWSAGWLTFVNLDQDQPAAVDAGEPVLSTHATAPTSIVVANRQSFTFRATERRATNGTVVFCDKTDGTPPRALVVSYTGRPRVAREDRHGNGYRCPE